MAVPCVRTSVGSRPRLLPPRCANHQGHRAACRKQTRLFCYGKTAVIKLSGRGQGTIASTDLTPGTLLFEDKPIAALPVSMEATQGTRLDLTDFVQHVLAKDLDRNPAFQALYDGSSEVNTKPWPNTEDLLKYDLISQRLSGWEKSRVIKAFNVVRFISLASAEDVLTCPEGRPPSIIQGLWPAYSKLNHSCIANAIGYLQGESIVVRAAKAIGVGEEVTIDYLGPSSLRLQPERQERLHSYGFKCTCSRCQAEEEYLGTGIQDVLRRVDVEAEPMILDMQNSVGTRDKLRSILAELDNLVDTVQKSFVRLRIPLHVRNFYLAGLAMTLLQAQAAVASALGMDGRPVLKTILPTMEGVVCGSTFHLSCAGQYLHYARRAGDDDKAAEDYFLQAVMARYGSTDGHLLSKLYRTCTRHM